MIGRRLPRRKSALNGHDYLLPAGPAPSVRGLLRFATPAVPASVRGIGFKVVVGQGSAWSGAQRDAGALAKRVPVELGTD